MQRTATFIDSFVKPGEPTDDEGRIPRFSLVRENIFELNGDSPLVEVGDAAGKLLVLTLGVTSIMEQQSLEVSVLGCSAAMNWPSKTLASFPPKSYCGLYSILLNLSNQLETSHLRVRWKIKRWSKATQNTSMMCAFFVDAEVSGARIASPCRQSNQVGSITISQ